MLNCFDFPQVTAVFEGLQQGRILCTAALDENVLLTAGENTVSGTLLPFSFSLPFLFSSSYSLFSFHYIHYSPLSLSLSPFQIVYVWNLRAGGPKERSPSNLSLKHTLHGHTGSILCLATSSSYNIIVSGSKVQYTPPQYTYTMHL